MESGSIAAEEPGAVQVSEHGLKKDAIGFREGLAIALASTAPAYSLAAVIGTLVVTGGVQAPAIILVSFIPMFFIAAAFFYMNRADPDCGTTFSWVTRTMGPWLGFIGGWAIATTGILVIGSLADIAAKYGFDLVGWDAAAESTFWVTFTAVVIIVVMGWICIVGTEFSARIQEVLLAIQIGGLALFAIAALVKVYGDDAPAGSVKPELSWFNPFEIDSFSTLAAGCLIGVFIYWGWESAVNLSEETEGGSAGRAGTVSTVLLLLTYTSVATAVIAFAGPEGVTAFDDDESIFSTLGADVLGSPWDKIVVLAIVTSALASTQTTILPGSRTTLSMARAGAFPKVLGKIHPRYFTPHISTIMISASAIAFYVIVKSISENALFDTITALGLMIAFYYALSGVACVIYYRRELTKSVKNFIFIGVAPMIGSLLLAGLFVKACVDFAKPEDSYSGKAWLGVGPPLVIGLGFIFLGVLLAIYWRFSNHPEFFGRKGFEAVPPEVASGEVKLEEDTAGAGRGA